MEIEMQNKPFSLYVNNARVATVLSQETDVFFFHVPAGKENIDITIERNNQESENCRVLNVCPEDSRAVIESEFLRGREDINIIFSPNGNEKKAKLNIVYHTRLFSCLSAVGSKLWGAE